MAEYRVWEEAFIRAAIRAMRAGLSRSDLAKLIDEAGRRETERATAEHWSKR